ncbi:MAG: ABC transporter permease [Thaumarchaeota archaeon]|jgi:ABC-2 type transport system permease protein|nr:ABC transporter permease [Nitrososphaerota archaeon]
MFDETLALTNRALKKWIRNPATVLPGLFTAAFYLALFGNSFNPTNLIPTQSGGVPIPAAALTQIKSTILGTTFGGAATYITYLAAGVICLIIVFNMSFGGIDLVLDRQLGYFNTLLTAPIPRAAIYFSGVFQNLAKAMFLALLTFIVALLIPNGLILTSSFGVLELLGAFLAFGLLGLGLSCLFTALALTVRTIDSLIAIVNFINLPLIFMSNALFPSSSFPDWLKAIAQVNPISKADEAARILIVNGNPVASGMVGTFAGDMIYLVGFVVLMAAFGYLIAAKALRPE